MATGLPFLEGEEWALVPGSEGRYAVSSIGRIWSIISDAPMRLSPRSSGHLGTSIRVGGKSYSVEVHSLMALAFLGPPPPRGVARHLDDNKRNNALVNIAWGTQADNLRDAVANGVLALAHSGEENPRALLTERDVAEIRILLDEGVSRRDISDAFGIHKSTLAHIARGRTWAGVA